MEKQYVCDDKDMEYILYLAREASEEEFNAYLKEQEGKTNNKV